MSGGSILRVLSLIVIVTVSSADNVQMTVTSQNIKIGGSVSITCKGSIDGTVIIGPSRQIRKRLTIKGQQYTYTVASSGSLLAPFKNSKRYTVTSEAEEYRDTLTISDIQLEDSGEYVCYFKPVGKTEKEESKTVYVMYPAENVQLESTRTVNDEIDVTPNAVVVVKCTVMNYHPKAPASAQVHVGNMDVTSQFSKKITENVTGEVRPGQQGGLVKVLYTTTLMANNFVILPAYAGKQLKCISSIGDRPVVKTINIKGGGKVVITCPDNVVSKLNTNGFNITCRVKSTPRISGNSVLWTWKTTSGNEESVTPNAAKGHYTVHTVGESEDTLTVVLKFNSVVKLNHFRRYKLVITSAQGRSEAVTTLQNKDALQVRDKVAHLAVSLVTMAICSIICYLIL